MKDESHDIVVYCDGLAGEKCANATVLKGKSRAACLTQSVKVGWTVDNGVGRNDWCPKCWAKMRGQIR